MVKLLNFIRYREFHVELIEYYIYLTGSLYDLWNQNYITMGSSDDPKYFTRVALGAYANPML
jgi:hypothetical protein